MDREDKKGIFFGVIGVLTLIVAIIGASLAYFSINASSKEDAVIVNAASVQIVYNDGQQIGIEGNLIPATSTAVKGSITRYLNAVETGENPNNYRMCQDDNKYTICDVYDFTLTNNGDDNVSVTAVIEPSELEGASTDGEGNTIPAEVPFKNLKFALYDTSEGFDLEDSTYDPIYQGTFTYDEVSKKYLNTGLFGATGQETQDIPGEGTSKSYRMLIWLNEVSEANGTPTAQDYEQGATFRGTVKINVSGAGVGNGQITGTVNQ